MPKSKGGGVFSCCSKGDRSDESDDDYPLEAIEPICPVAAVDSYEGGTEKGQFHGHGRASFSDGSLYDGAWVANVQQGDGRWVGTLGDRYEGQWEKGQFSGEGVYTYSDVTTYTGQFAAGRMHGQGTMRALSGSRYTGSWHGGQKHGQGTFTYLDGSVYTGAWQYDERSGRGSHRTVDGIKFDGTWEQDSLEGAASIDLGGRDRGILEAELCSVGDNELEVSGVLRVDVGAVRAEQRILVQSRASQEADTVWSSLFGTCSTEWCGYDDTARRMDQCLIDQLSQINDRNDEAIAIGEHLKETLDKPVHPFGVVVHQFVDHFHRRYSLPDDCLHTPGATGLGAPSISYAALLLKRAVSDVGNFLTSFKGFFCGVLSDCLTTKSRKLHAHAVLLDVVFPQVYDTLWVLYCATTSVPQGRFQARVACLASASCSQLGVRADLLLHAPTPVAVSPECPTPSGWLPVPPSASVAVTALLDEELRTSAAACSASADRAAFSQSCPELHSSPSSSSGPSPLVDGAIAESASGDGTPALMISIPTAHNRKGFASQICGVPHSPKSSEPNECSVLMPPPSPSPLRTNSRPTTPAIVTARESPYSDAIAQFQLISELRTPTEKINCLKATSSAIMGCIERFHEGSSKEMTIGAEDKFPIVLFVLVQAAVPLLCAEVALLQDCLDQKTRSSTESGYRVTELQAAIDHLSSLEISGVAEQASVAQVTLQMEEE